MKRAKKQKIRRSKVIPDTDRAVAMLNDAMADVVEACLDRYDPSTFIIITQCCASQTIAETCGSAKLMEPGGIEDIVKFASQYLATQLRNDLTERLEHEQKQVRH